MRLILDGGLATELERRGHDLSDVLWSARLLFDAPDALRPIHRDYLEAGADCIITATYQATIEGFMGCGLEEAEAIRLIELAVEIAVQERDRFWANEENRIGRNRPLVAASIGPYGAYLANGAEYTGDYELDRTGLIKFHRRRWHLLAESSADLLACETIPSFAEAQAYIELLRETPQRNAWFSFTCQNEMRISDGTEIREIGRYLAPIEQIIAIGFNCIPPQLVPALIANLQNVTDKPVIVYPNSGEVWDAKNRCWQTETGDSIGEFAHQAVKWHKAGATIIGGCCRTTPATIRAIRQQLTTIK